MLTRRCTIRVVLASLVLAAAVESPAAQSTTGEPWPPPGVYRTKDKDVTPPRLVFEAKPQYTRQAMRARLEGIVVLSAVVNPDGSVGSVKVVRSLDRDLGLDDAAIGALKQWRFEPARKDGSAVPFLVVIEMSFSLAGSPPVLEWPASFSASATPAGWSERTVTASTLEFRLAFPPDWEAHDGGASRLLMVHDATGARTLTIDPPRPTTMRIDKPVPSGRLRLTLDRLKALAADHPGEIASVGQVEAGGHLWLWVEATLPSLDRVRAAMPPDLAERWPFESGRLWIFSTTAGGQFVQVGAHVLYAGGLSAKEIEESTRAAGADFVRIIERLSITPR